MQDLLIMSAALTGAVTLAFVLYFAPVEVLVTAAAVGFVPTAVYFSLRH